MPVSEARVATPKPAPYMKQLCKHFGHKIPTSFDDSSGRIEFESGIVELDATAAGELVMVARADTPELLERVQDVTGSHLERFGRRDELAVAWSPRAEG